MSCFNPPGIVPVRVTKLPTTSFMFTKVPSTYLDQWLALRINFPRDLILRHLLPDYNPTCRLINPSKSEIGVISKNILDRINKEVIQATKVNLWKSTNNTIEWCKAIPEKEKHAFITFDVCDFYPSISEDLLLNALDYSSKFITITPQDCHIIIHAKTSLLYHQNSPWTKKNTNDMFDVTMGSYELAETCELIGIYMLSLIASQMKMDCNATMVLRFAKPLRKKLKKPGKKSAMYLTQRA